MTSRYRPRKMFKFWLYHDRDEDSRLMEFIQYCKSTRQFARVVRDGIRLIWSLREGNTTILFELFPHLERQFNPDAETLIAEFREMLLANRAAPVQQALPGLADIDPPPKPSKLQKAIAMPIIEDEPDDGATIVLEHRTVSNTRNADNLMAGIFGLGS